MNGGSEPTFTKGWLVLPSLEETPNTSSDTLSSDKTTTMSSSSPMALPSGEQQQQQQQHTRLTDRQPPPLNVRQHSGSFSERPFITLTSTGMGFQESLTGKSSNTTHNSPPASSSTAKSPSTNPSSFFANFRPSSPKIQMPLQPPTTKSRDDAASLYSSANNSSRKGIERERDISLNGSESSSSRNRRPSSVFEHVGGMWDRFGRRLQSRGEADRRRLSSSMPGLNESAVDVVESGSCVDDHSPNESITHTLPTASQLPNWERMSASISTAAVSTTQIKEEKGPGISWSPVLDEGHRSRPGMKRNESSSSSNGEGSRTNAPSSLCNTVDVLIERILIQVTEDSERFSVVDITGLDTAAAIKEKVMSKLHIFEEDPSCFAMLRTEIGISGPGGPVLSGDELLALCKQDGDKKGSLKFLLQQVAPPSHSNHSMLPPPRSSTLSPKLGLREGQGDQFHNALTPKGKANHSNSDSFSSRSSIGDVLSYGESGGVGAESGSEASGRHGALHRARATARRMGATSSVSSAEDIRSPILTNRSPSQPNTPLLPSVEEQEISEKTAAPVSAAAATTASASTSVSTSVSTSASTSASATTTPLSSSKRPNRPERSEKRNGQSPSDSSVEEIRDLVASDSTSRPIRRSIGNSRPNSSHASFRTSLHGQYESEVMTTSSRTSQGSSAPLSPQPRQEVLPERRASDRTPSQPPPGGSVEDRGALNLPKSLQPGGREPRAIDAADAAHMYLGGSSSPLDESPHTRSYKERSIYQQPTHEVHNARSVDDMRRRSRAKVLSSMPEVPPLNREQLLAGGQWQGNPSGPSIDGQGSTDAHLGHHRPNSALSPQQFHHDSRNTAIRPRPNFIPERERAFSNPTDAAAAYHLSSSAMMGRPSSASQGHVPGPRSARLTSPQMPRPLTPTMMQQPIRQEGRPYAVLPPNILRPSQYGNEFVGVPRTQIHGPTLHHYASDPRLISPPFTPSRPSPNIFDQQQRFRPPPGHARPIVVQPVHREDPFTSSRFPASSSRTVSEFQRHPNSDLQPGMTVQETMQRQRQQQGMTQLVTHHQQQQNSRPADYRDPRNYPSNRPPTYTLQHPIPFNSSPLILQQQQQPPHNHQGSIPIANHHPPVQQRQQHRQQQHQQHQQHQQQPQSAAATVGSSRSTWSSSKTPPPAAVPLRPRTSGLDEWGAPTERSSGSSFATVSSSHRRNLSSEDRHSTGWVEETYSAPTSARSSRSDSIGAESKLRSTNSAFHDDPDIESELPYSAATDNGSDLHYKDSLADEDLINLRPLPKVPPRIDGLKGANKEDNVSETLNENENTLRAAEWRRMLISMESERDEGDPGTSSTIKRSNLLSPKTSETNESESSGTSNKTVVPLDNVKAQAEDEEGGTFATFDDEDDYDEGGTWAHPLDTLPLSSKEQNSTKSRSLPSFAYEGAATLRPGDDLTRSSMIPSNGSPRRPILTLSIEPSVNGSPSLAESVSPKSTSTHIQHLHSDFLPRLPQQPDNSLGMPSPSTVDINRRMSFARREIDWAFRPPPEQLYDNLDAFFPKHDLDKPVLDNNQSPLPTSPQALSSRQEVPATSPAPFSNTNRSRFVHKKSIRIVAQDRKRFLDRAEALERRKIEGEGLNRRRSTKLFGSKVVEVTPGSSSSSSSGGLESPLSETGARPVFKWVKGDLIGKGTYGRVYLALNATTGEMIAVKQVELPTTDSDREDARQKGVVSSLKSEIETLKDLDHCNIVSYLGFEETINYLSIFLEYVPGGSVGSCLRKHGKLEEATIKSFLKQILDGLNYLHNRGILHRDLKADNLLVDFNGIVKISDFGTVRKSEDIYGNIASMSIQGSIFWMAPEVVSLSRAGYSAKVDIWSLGCVVLEMFAGRRPWSDEEAVQAMFKIGAERKPPPIPPDAILSRPATHFLKVCFAVDPASRPTAQRLLEHVFPHPEPGWQFSDSSLYQALHR